MVSRKELYLGKCCFCKKWIISLKKLGKVFWKISWVFLLKRFELKIPWFVKERDLCWKHFWWGKIILTTTDFKRKSSWVLFSKENFWVPKIPWLWRKRKIPFKPLLIQKISLIIFFEKKFQHGKRKLFFFLRRKRD